MIRALLVALALLAGCAPTFGEPVDVDVVRDAAEQWEAHGFAFAAQCQQELARGDVTVAYASSADELTAYCGSSGHAGCSVHVDGHTSIAIDGTLSAREQERVLQHELRHWLLRCSTGDSDHAHANERAWYPLRDGRTVLGAGDRAD